MHKTRFIEYLLAGDAALWPMEWHAVLIRHNAGKIDAQSI
jgi:hypothetical protein